MGEKDIEEKQGKKPSSSDEAIRQPPPLERKISLAAADDSSDSENEDDEDGGAGGSGQEGGASGDGVVDSADLSDSGSEKSTPPMTEYVVNVVSGVQMYMAVRMRTHRCSVTRMSKGLIFHFLLPHYVLLYLSTNFTRKLYSFSLP